MGLSGSEHSRTTVNRASERDLVVTRTFAAPPRILFKAWTTPELFMRWWAPKSMGVPMRSCDMDVRVGGQYRVEFGHDAEHARAFYGRYTDVVPDARLVWTNEEDENDAVTTVTFEAADGGTLLTYHERYASKEALDEAYTGMEGGITEQLDQLDELLAAMEPEIGAA